MQERLQSQHHSRTKGLKPGVYVTFTDIDLDLEDEVIKGITSRREIIDAMKKNPQLGEQDNSVVQGHMFHVSLGKLMDS